jgi:hypothetical protein
MDGESPASAYSDDELYALFRKLFPCGLAGADVREELDAEDWEDSPFYDLGANWPAIRSMIRRTRNKRTDAQIARELGALAADGGEWQAPAG